ncbi:aldehyde dehydrogenase 6B2 [Actinidia rufa]|uniref:Aldehyde dehydrogenase 6B2 n=1 Tax=Actinidia rufa TaxID=165716 RepID=A0A7J0FA56_9ERIC|nr:aldehyde dehydrogenase 6B2 [Actinidia rufa]
MDIRGLIGLPETPQMLPPPPGSFLDREELIQHVGEFALSQGYVVTIKQSRKDRDVILGCDRGGVYRNRRKPIEESSAEQSRRKKTGSRLTNCPFECVGKKDDDLWVLTIKNGAHNHEPLKDISEHPSARRFTESEVVLIKEMTEAGLKPRQILKRLRQSNPELLSTPKHVYNIKSRLRQGNVSVKRFKTLRTQPPAVGNLHLPTTSEPSWRQRNPPRVPNLIASRFVGSQSSTSMTAFPSWRDTPVTTRQRIMFKLRELIRRDIDKLAMNVTTEQGKTLKDSYNEVLRGLEVAEHACGTASMQMGDFASNMSNGIDNYTIREPLGVCSGICPSNFLAMVPLWMFLVAVTCGNTFILKPSEKDPGASITLAELALEAGLPKGVLNIVHGTHDIVNSICDDDDDDDVKVASFVGSETASMYGYKRPSASGKRVIQSNMRAKNHAIVMPDASMDTTLSALVAAGFGSAGQKCVTISTVIFVEGSHLWEDKLVELVKSLKVIVGTESDADLGPVISQQAKERICRLIESGIDSGARLALDGRDVVVPGYESGNFVGPTILSDVSDEMEWCKEEILGPVLLCMEADNLEEATNMVNRSKCSGGASIFTTSAAAARQFQTEIEAGQVGINIPVATPLPFFSFTGSKASFIGDLNFSGEAGVQFYTQVKTVTQQWKDFPNSDGVSFATGESLAFTISEGSQQTENA